MQDAQRARKEPRVALTAALAERNSAGGRTALDVGVGGLDAVLGGGDGGAVGVRAAVGSEPVSEHTEAPYCPAYVPAL